jgi:hypothetical protein
LLVMTIIYQDLIVWKLNRNHRLMFFVWVYVHLSMVTVIELIVFSYNKVIV